MQQLETSQETATLLVVSQVQKWQRAKLPADVPFDELDATVERLAKEKGIDVSKPFPVRVQGELRERGPRHRPERVMTPLPICLRRDGTGAFNAVLSEHSSRCNGARDALVRPDRHPRARLLPLRTRAREQQQVCVVQSVELG